MNTKLIIGSALFGIMLILMAFFSSMWLFLALLCLESVFLGVTQTVINPIIQKSVDKKDLGKVFSALETLAVGVIPLASIFFGSVSLMVSETVFFIIFGCIYLIAASLYRRYIPTIE